MKTFGARISSRIPKSSAHKIREGRVWVGNLRFLEPSGVSPEQFQSSPKAFWEYFRAPKSRLVVIAEPPKFAHPGRLLAPLGVFRAHWTSPLGPLGLLLVAAISSKWCEALFRRIGLSIFAGWGRSWENDPCNKTAFSPSILSTFCEFLKIPDCDFLRALIRN